MFTNHLIQAWRSLWRRRFFSLLNIFGLAFAMAFSLLIFVWIQDELSFDQFHVQGSRIYRVLQTQFYEDGKVTSSDRTPAQLAAGLKSVMPEVERSVMLSQLDRYSLQVEDHVFRAQGSYASEDLFFIFSFPLIAGDPARCLTTGDQIVISQKMAVNYFGSMNPLGKAIRIDNTKDYFVSGVFKDIPGNSSLQFDFLLPFKEYEDFPWAKDWEAIGDRTFVLLERGASIESLKSKIKFFLQTKLPESKDQLGLQPFLMMYLYSDFNEDTQNGGRIDNVRIFGWVAVLVLVVACINFMNLSTAQSVERSKEVGIRKVIGASKFLLVRQFMGEAALTVGLALALSLVVVEMTLPWFSQFTEKNLLLPYSSLYFIGALLTLAFFTGIASGVYPALFLSSLMPTSALKGMSRTSRGALDFRRSLVVFQFILSTVFIVSTIVVSEQLKYIQTKDLGLDRENIIYQTFEGELRKNFDAFSSELSNAPGIKSVTYSNQPLLNITYPSTWVEWPGKDREVAFAFAGVGYDYVETMKIKMVSGRYFSRQVGSDSANVLVNEAAVKQMGLANPLGHEITTRRDIKRKGKIIGVMKDFHLQSLRAPIEPLYLFLDLDPGFGFVTARTEAGKTQEAIASMERANRKFNPYFPFEYTFAEDDFNRAYNADATLQQLAGAFSGITILISCLGLFGLTAFSAEQRTREIGIRKVLGASISGILRLLSTDFIRLVLIALLIATPLAWYATDRWLQGYAYRIEFSWWSIGMAGSMTLLLTIFTIASQVIKVALRNPVHALRAE